MRSHAADAGALFLALLIATGIVLAANHLRGHGHEDRPDPGLCYTLVPPSPDPLVDLSCAKWGGPAAVAERLRLNMTPTAYYADPMWEETR